MSQTSSEYKKFVNTNRFLDLPYMCNQKFYDDLVNDVNTFKPKSVYDVLAKELLKVVLLPSLQDKFIQNVNGVSLGFVYQRNYQGRMADKNNKNRPKRGLFDFRVQVAQQSDTTHYQLFSEIINKSNFDNCKKIWDGGIPPNKVTNDPDEQLVLYILMLMMFEQEVNWGDEQIQEFSAFSPLKKAEPRDMLMGFIHMMFKGGHSVTVDNISDWKINDKSQDKMTPMFGQDNKYSTYPKRLKDPHFRPHRGKAETGGMMLGEMRSLFLRASHLFKSNN
ncbi:hypothetical protein EXW62_27435 (plasmid) [Bacillus mycoides]|uniref:hypothetical protein n=1 Tax=Bacillus mycoides TaxID=1405 RepID=UPI001C019884|nr:hypothetical protein [Bacillus mycoides]QWH20731.1 hypothetical protein EXW62_27435 [Bacillus mycoides]